jgi:DNA polymerase III gamma/tau subunit
MLDVWGDKPVLDMSDKLKIQKLKNMVKTIDKLDIKDEYKINLLNKYLSDGSDMSARLNDVIKTLQNLSIIKKQIPDKNKGNFDRILDDLLSDFTLFKSNSKQFLEKINSIS